MKGQIAILMRPMIWVMILFALMAYVAALQYNFDTFTFAILGLIIGFIVSFKFGLR